MARDGDALLGEMAAWMILLGLRLSLCAVDRRKLIEDRLWRLEASSTGRLSSGDCLSMEFECVYERMNEVKEGTWAKLDRMKDGRLDLEAEARREGGVFNLVQGNLDEQDGPPRHLAV